MSAWKENWFSTMAGFAFYLVLLSVMGWCAMDWPPATKAPVLVDKQQLKLYTAAELAAQTARINAEMDKRAKR